MSKRVAIAFGAWLLAGCAVNGTGGAPLIPDQKLVLTKALSVPLTTAVSAVGVIGVVNAIYDPLAPNWEIEEVRLGEDTYRLSMKMKRYHTGGSGESMLIMKRRAIQLQQEQGFATYQILEYLEGIESQTLGARRFAEGVVRLVQR